MHRSLQQCQGKGSHDVAGRPDKAVWLYLLFSKSHFIFHPEAIKVYPSLMLLLRWVPGTWEGGVFVLRGIHHLLALWLLSSYDSY